MPSREEFPISLSAERSSVDPDRMRQSHGVLQMAIQSIRDQAQDHLITPKNSALIIIDYQPVQVSSIASMDRRDLVMNIVAVARAARLYGLPIVLSTVNVKTGANQPTIRPLTDVLGKIEALDRTT